MNGTSEVEKAEELISKIMFLLNAPAQRLATALKRALTTGFFEVACAGKCCTAKLRLAKGMKLSADFRYTCKKCIEDRSVADSPDKIEKSLEGKSPGEQPKILSAISPARRARGCYVDYVDGTSRYVEPDYDRYRSDKGKERSKRWRENNPERAADYKRRQRAGVKSGQIKAVPPEAWYAKLEQLGSVCSGCPQPLTRETAIRWLKVPLDEGGAYEIENLIPVCTRCRGKKAAEVRRKKEKRRA
jgi:5-methylcytosine-specific restriction endonuclease McrA